jgi:tetratricopeptide (TPR) repeat protein
MAAKSPETQSDAEYDVARDLFFKGSPRAALDHALKAVELNEDNSRALYFTAALYLSFCTTDRGLKHPDCRLTDAEAFARRAIRADGSFRDAQNLLGQVLILQGRLKDAIAILEPLTKDPAYTETHLAWGNYGWALVLAGRLDEGIVALRNAVTQPQFCVGHYRLGVALERKGDLALAEEALSQALLVESPECTNLQDAWEARARVRVKLGRVREARGDLERCKEIAGETDTGRACARSLNAKVGP